MEKQLKQLISNVKAYCMRVAMLVASIAFVCAALITVSSETAKAVLAFKPLELNGNTKEAFEYALGDVAVESYSDIQNQKMVALALQAADEVEPEPEYVDVEEKVTEIVAAAYTEQAVTTTAAASAPVYTNVATVPGYEYIGTYVTTGYCPCAKCCGKTNGITASGTHATANRTIAADTSVLPFGTQVVINGQVYTVEDRGGAIRGGRIDIFFSTHQEALNYGRRSADVYRYVGGSESASLITMTKTETTSSETAQDASTEEAAVKSTETSASSDSTKKNKDADNQSDEVKSSDAVSQSDAAKSTETGSTADLAKSTETSSQTDAAKSTEVVSQSEHANTSSTETSTHSTEVSASTEAAVHVSTESVNNGTEAPAVTSTESVR